MGHELKLHAIEDALNGFIGNPRQQHAKGFSDENKKGRQWGLVDESPEDHKVPPNSIMGKLFVSIDKVVDSKIPGRFVPNENHTDFTPYKPDVAPQEDHIE